MRSLREEKKSQYISQLLLEFPVINEIFLEVVIDHNRIISLEDIVKKRSYLSGSTLTRRARHELKFHEGKKTRTKNLG